MDDSGQCSGKCSRSFEWTSFYLKDRPVFSVWTVHFKVPFKVIFFDFSQLIAISTVLSNPGRPSTLTNDRSIYAHKNDGPSSPSQKRTKNIRIQNSKIPKFYSDVDTLMIMV